MSRIIKDNLQETLKDFLSLKETQTVIEKIEDSEDYSFKVVMTHESPDRDNETVKVSGMDATSFLKNPVTIINHDYKVEKIVGKIVKLYVEGDKIIAEGIFAKWVEMAEVCRSLYNQGCLKTVSMGFIVKERDPKDRSIITKWELLELSFVPVPANAGALSLDGKTYQKALEMGIVKEEKEKSYNGCVMLDLHNSILRWIEISYIDMYHDTKIWGWGWDNWDKHITLLYWLSSDVSRKDVMSKVKYNNETINVTKIKAFEMEDYDVLVAEVELTPFLKRLNDSLKKLDHKNDYPEYSPHITIAYLKKGRYKNYVTDDFTITWHPTRWITYSPSDENWYYHIKETQEDSTLHKYADKIDNAELINSIKTIGDDVSKIKEGLKTFTDDKVRREKMDDLNRDKELWQLIVGRLSKKLGEVKEIL